MRRSDVQFAWSGDVTIAYEVVGDGPIDLVYLPPHASNLDWHWEFEPYVRFLERLASFSRLIVIDRRGWGLSDRVTPGSYPPLEVAADDIITVLDAVGSSRSGLFAGSRGCVGRDDRGGHASRSLLGTRPVPGERRPLSAPRRPRGTTRRSEVARGRGVLAQRGNTSLRGGVDPGVRPLDRRRRGGDRLVHEARRGGRSAWEGASRSSSSISRPMFVAILPAIRVPTLVLFKPENDTQPPEAGPHLASKIAGAKLVALPGADYLPWFDEPDALLGEVEEFLTGVRPVPEADRILATVLFTDIVDSTGGCPVVGDQAWAALVEQHHRIVARATSRGTEAPRWIRASDGFFARRSTTGRERCAARLRSWQPLGRPLDSRLRAGVHTGEMRNHRRGRRGRYRGFWLGARVCRTRRGPDRSLRRAAP